jgi:UDP-N-acetylmuramoylalanine--D-glutamate ligase
VSTSSRYSQKKIFILGAGVTGLACAQSLKSRDAHITLIDDSVTQVDGFEVVSTSSVTKFDCDYLLISPGWKESHPLIAQAMKSDVTLSVVHQCIGVIAIYVGIYVGVLAYWYKR